MNHALRGGSANEVLVTGFKLEISRRDLMTLSGLNWLNDEVSVLSTLLFPFCCP